MTIDQPALYGETDRPPYYAAEGSDHRSAVTLRLPTALIERLAEAEKTLGVAVSDLVAYYADRGVKDAERRHRRFLDDLDDHGRIVGWMPDGTFLDRDSR